MPQVVGLMLLGAGLYAGFKALSRILTTNVEPVAKPEPVKAAGAEKDLGRLEWDEAAQVYRPSGRDGRGGPAA